MLKKGELVSFRPDIKVVDCTLRDGGLVNNFFFTDDFVRDLYQCNIQSGIDNSMSASSASGNSAMMMISTLS